jgi:hypothetical protein
MAVVLTTANCVISEAAPYICTQCGNKYRGPNTIAICLLGSPPWQAVKTATVAKPKPKHRPRTIEEYAIVTGICYRCDHYQPEGICGLKAKGGCGACRDGAAFTRFKKSGAPCPAKPPRFAGTPLVEPSTDSA